MIFLNYGLKYRFKYKKISLHFTHIFHNVLKTKLILTEKIISSRFN